MRIYPAIRAQMGDWQYYTIRMRDVVKSPAKCSLHKISMKT